MEATDQGGGRDAAGAGVVISPFTPARHAAATALWEQSAGIGMSDADTEANITAYLLRNPGMSFVAENADGVAGAVLCGHDGRRGYLHHLVVRPDCRRLGVGRALVAAGLSALRAAGIVKCHLFVKADNMPGRAFWEAIGWHYRSDLGIMSIHLPRPDTATAAPAVEGEGRVVDLTHPLTPQMPLYPDTPPPRFDALNTFSADGFREQAFTMSSHTGTHVDAPSHMIAGGRTLDRFPADRFVGRGCVVKIGAGPGERIGIDRLAPRQEAIAACDFVLLSTGWGRHWNQDRYIRDYPVLSEAAARWLNRFALKGVGFDTLSPDPVDSTDFPVHRCFLEQDRIIVENLANLESLPEQGFLFSCLPLKTPQADGSPVRAVAVLDRRNPTGAS